MKIVSHTIVKNGQPFIGAVLKAALPIVDRMLITLSKKSTDGTKEIIESLMNNHPKIELSYEDVSNLGQLTQERQLQVNDTEEGDIIWFLDDDDFWQEDQARGAIEYLANNDLDAVSVNPYQILNLKSEDANWVGRKYFTKFFKNVDINYRGAWPRDLIYKGDTLLYHKTNPRNKTVPFKFWHLAAVKKHSFRRKELLSFNDLAGKPTPLNTEIPTEVSWLL